MARPATGLAPTKQEYLRAAMLCYKSESDATSFGRFRRLVHERGVTAWKEDGDGTPVMLVAVKGSKVASDWYDANVKTVLNNVEASQRYIDAKQVLYSLHDQYPGKYYLTGHSLGGGIVQQLMRETPWVEHAWVFNASASPRDIAMPQTDRISRTHSDTDALGSFGSSIELAAWSAGVESRLDVVTTRPVEPLLPAIPALGIFSPETYTILNGANALRTAVIGHRPESIWDAPGFKDADTDEMLSGWGGKHRRHAGATEPLGLFETPLSRPVGSSDRNWHAKPTIRPIAGQAPYATTPRFDFPLSVPLGGVSSIAFGTAPSRVFTPLLR